jgi:hypothetical protein
MANGLSPLGVAQGFLASLEQNTLLVTAFYDSFLARQPELAGQEYWVSQLMNQFQTLAEVASNILGSEEFQSRAQQAVVP